MFQTEMEGTAEACPGYISLDLVAMAAWSITGCFLRKNNPRITRRPYLCIVVNLDGLIELLIRSSCPKKN